MIPVKIKDIVREVKGILLCGDENKEIIYVSTNSKDIKDGSLFVPIIGEKVDAHTFIEHVLEQGAEAVFTSKHIIRPDCKEDKAYILVEDTKKALQDFAAYYRSLFSIPVVGITGSVGKTTTKEMVAAALAVKYKVLKTEGNMNSQIGLALMMFRIERDTQIAVIEMGISEEGEMERLVHIAKPETAVVTNIGVSHIGQLGSKENIRKEKLNIINEMKPGGKLYVNADDTLLSEVGSSAAISLSKNSKNVLNQVDCVYYGMGENAQALAKNIKTAEKETSFDFVYDGEYEAITLSVLGNHNVGNALAALAVAKQYGISTAAAKTGLKAYAPIARRGQILEYNGVQIIDDTYNASPDSMKSGIDVLLEIKALTRRIAVLADVLELGSVSRDCHFEVGEYIAEKAIKGHKLDLLVTVGEEAKAIADGAKNQVSVASFANNAQAAMFLKENIVSGDSILIKGSRGMHMEELVNALSGRNE